MMVRLIFTPLPLAVVCSSSYPLRGVKTFELLLSNSEQDVQTQTHTDHRDRIDQTHYDEELGTTQENQFRLTSSTFQELATQDTDADSSTNSTQTQHQHSNDVQHCFHFFSPTIFKVKLVSFFKGKSVVQSVPTAA